MNDALEALKPLIAVFERIGVTYRVGGSLASSVHGIARTTLDADLVANLQPEHVNAIVQALGKAYYADADLMREALQHEQAFNLIHLETMNKIDVFPLSNRAYDQDSFQRSIRVRDIEFITPEDSVLRKLEWYQLSNGSERQWRDVIGVIRVQGDQLDLGYVRRWAVALGLEDLLNRVLEDAKQEEQS